MGGNEQKVKSMDIENRVCVICGEEYKPIRINQKYCPLCQKKAKDYDLSKQYICKTCGKPFYKHREAKGIYCSQECSRADPNSPQLVSPNRTKPPIKKADPNTAIKRKEKEEEKQRKRLYIKLIRILQEEIHCKEAHQTRECEYCGKAFQAKRKDMVFCSSKCRYKYKTMLRDERIYKNSKPDLTITLSKLYDKHNGICSICGVQCDWHDIEVREDGVMIAGNSYPSIDHIQPLSKGGKHEWSNVQLACRHCNSLKSDKNIPPGGNSV